MNIQHLNKSIKEHNILKDVCLRIYKPQVVGLLGVNGAGKSTLFKIITKLWKPTTVETLDIEPAIGYLPENNPLYNEMYVREYLQFIASLCGFTKGEPLLETVGLTAYADHKIKTLSRGYKQRVGLAATLIGDPQVLLLDEPTTGLDPLQQAEIHNLIRNLGRTKIVLFSSHNISEIQDVCERVLILKQGTIQADLSNMDDIRTSLQEYL